MSILPTEPFDLTTTYPTLAFRYEEALRFDFEDGYGEWWFVHHREHDALFFISNF